MSIIVKGMEIPENCLKCIQSGFRTAIGCAEWAKISAGRRATERALSCPISALPDKHGRLVDADELIHELNNSHYLGAPYVNAGINIAIGKVCDASTIVEQEDES